jgi:Zn-finger nucleic acid-binding protein
MSERSGIEIDYCPQCRGVWLDRGELDKIIERSTTQQAPPAESAPRGSYDAPHGSYDQRLQGQQPYRKKKKESWLSEIFD